MESVQNGIVYICVGGRNYEVSEATLLNSESQYFRRILDAENDDLGGALINRSGSISLERCGISFGHILQYLVGALNLDHLAESEKEKLLVEAEYFGIDSLVREIKNLAYDADGLCTSDYMIRLTAELLKGDIFRHKVPATIDKDYLVDLFPDGGQPCYKVPVDLNEVLYVPGSNRRQEDVNYTFLFLRPAGNARRLLLMHHSSASVGSRTQTIEPNSLDDFRKRLVAFGGPFLKELPMKNLVLAGGSVLAVLTGGECLATKSDLDFYIVLSGDENDSNVAAQQVVNELLAYILRFHKKTNKHSIGVMRTANALTIFFGHPQRHIQIILTCYESVTGILMDFDIDSCQVAYDGKKVWATPSGLRALKKGFNIP